MKKRLALLAAACLCMAVSMTSFAADKSDIVVAVDADVDTLHPTDFSTTVELGVLNQIYDTRFTTARMEQKIRSRVSQRAMRSAMTDWIIPSI